MRVSDRGLLKEGGNLIQKIERTARVLLGQPTANSSTTARCARGENGTRGAWYSRLVVVFALTHCDTDEDRTPLLLWWSQALLGLWVPTWPSGLRTCVAWYEYKGRRYCCCYRCWFAGGGGGGGGGAAGGGGGGGGAAAAAITCNIGREIHVRTRMWLLLCTDSTL